MRNSLKIAREIIQQPAFDDYRGDEIFPGENFFYEKNTYIFRPLTNFYHRKTIF